jgi:hydroxysqualene dehydroxylase
MNETPDRASAAPFLMMLREGTFQRGIDQGLAFPRVGLSQLLVDPALSWLTEQGASVLTGKPVASINISDSTVHSVTLKNGDIREADAFVCALPPRELHQLMQRSGLADDEPWSRLTRWESVPIMSVHLWYDRPILPQPMVGLIGSRFHWAFDKSLCAMRHAPCAKEKMARPAHSAQRIAHSKSCIALILSACREEVQWSRAETIEKATDEIARYFPQSRHATLQHAQVTKELHATVSVAKGSAAARLSARTPWPNMVLAGDWTQTYLPATIEGAIRSGENAANLCSNVEPKLWQPLDQRVPINLR